VSFLLCGMSPSGDDAADLEVGNGVVVEIDAGQDAIAILI
jgi:hypothetical protein